MANGHGGKRTPRNPAPVSGPGAMSKRTDGKQGAKYIAGMPYGEGQDFYELQSSQPMAEAPPAPRPRQGGGGMNMPSPMPTPLTAPTEAPDEPVTAGSPFGPGPGPQRKDTRAEDTAVLKKWLPLLESAAQSHDTPDSVRALVRYIRGA